MSGGGGGPMPPVGRPHCASLKFTAVLSSPNPKVLIKVRVGDKGDVVISTVDGVNVILVYSKAHRDSLGSITSHVTELLNCINSGFHYRAEVTAVSGGMITVRVEPLP